MGGTPVYVFFGDNPNKNISKATECIKYDAFGCYGIALVKKRIKALQTDGQTDIWDRFGTTLEQIPFAFPGHSGSEAKSHW